MIQTNHTSYQEEIEKLIKSELPKLKKLGIADIAFRRFLDNGKTIGYCSNEKWNSYFSQHPEITSEMANYYRKEIIDVIKNNRQFCLRVGDAHAKSPFLKILYDCGLWNIMAIYRRSSKKIEGYYFVSSITNNEAIDSYLNNLDYLQNFITLLAPRLDNIFSDKKFTDQYIQIFDASFAENFKVKKEKFQILKSSSLKLKKDGKSYCFAKREIESLVLLASGYKVKEIARLMEISPKTVESYLLSIKEKLGMTTRKETIEFAHETCLTTLLEK